MRLKRETLMIGVSLTRLQEKAAMICRLEFLDFVDKGSPLYKIHLDFQNEITLGESSDVLLIIGEKNLHRRCENKTTKIPEKKYELLFILASWTRVCLEPFPDAGKSGRKMKG